MDEQIKQTILQLYEISNPEIVLNNAKKVYGDDVVIGISFHKNKKYQILDPNTGKYFHFGSSMEDYTYHKDDKRRENFLKRNAKWKDADKYTPAFASYWLLWHI
jgi:thiamine monophosphate synthase